MFGRKDKKAKNGKIKYTKDGKIKISSLPKEEQDRILADMKEIGDRIAEHYQQIMNERLERAKAVVDQGISNPDGSDDK